MHTTKVTQDETCRKYVDMIPFTRDLGFVKINGYESHKTNLKVERHPFNYVLIQATLANDIAVKCDPTHPNSANYDKKYYAEYQWTWTPYWMDTIQDTTQYRLESRIATVRSGNRLTIELREEGDYLITIPNDCDICAKILTGDIDYLTPPQISNGGETGETNQVNTSLQIKGSSVNICGDSGSSTPDEQSWLYYWGKSSDPTTRLETKNGKVTVPVLSSNKQTTQAHRSVWAMMNG